MSTRRCRKIWFSLVAMVVFATAAAFYYLVRGSNACDIGTYGFDSGSTERVSPVCP